MPYKVLWTFDNNELAKEIIGPLNKYLSLIEEEMDIDISFINNNLVTNTNITNEQITLINNIMEVLTILTNKSIKWNEHDLIHILATLNSTCDDNQVNELIEFYSNKIIVLNTYEGKKIYAKTLTQRKYIEYLTKANLIFATGSAGTGKTYLGVAYAVNALKKGIVKKIIITRPVVEAGEKLGFLPGDLKEKIDPYLVPIYDALEEFLDHETLIKMMEKGSIEIAPLAYMRGRTLDNAFIILDEAQNATRSQMKMFVTRLGFNSKMIITGDITQIDLPNKVNSGLVEAVKILKGIKGIEHIVFSKNDVMRHPLVSKIITRYEEVNND